MRRFYRQNCWHCWHARRPSDGELQWRRGQTTREVGDAVGGRRPSDANVCGLRPTHQWPVFTARGAGPRVACCVPQVRRLWTTTGRNVYLLCTRRKDILSSRLYQVRPQQQLYYTSNRNIVTNSNYSARQRSGEGWYRFWSCLSACLFLCPHNNWKKTTDQTLM